ncbi:MAG: hypothetical protein ACREP1_10655, partial [Rhodanobacteraceae bacterium]
MPAERFHSRAQPVGTALLKERGRGDAAELQVLFVDPGTFLRKPSLSASQRALLRQSGDAARLGWC